MEGIEVGGRLTVCKIDGTTEERLGLLTAATVDEGGWVGLTEPIIMRAGEAFVAGPELEAKS